MYVYIHIYVNVCMYVYVYTYIYTYTYVHTSSCARSAATASACSPPVSRPSRPLSLAGRFYPLVIRAPPLLYYVPEYSPPPLLYRLQVSAERVAQLQELAARPDIYEELAESLAPSIWELDDIKKVSHHLIISRP